MSDDEDTIYLQKFWPTPNVPPFVTIELNLRRADPISIEWMYSAEIHVGTIGNTVGCAGSFNADTREQAISKASFSLIAKLGELAADLVNERDDYKRLLEIEKQNDRRQPGAR